MDLVNPTLFRSAMDANDLICKFTDCEILYLIVSDATLKGAPNQFLSLND